MWKLKYFVETRINSHSISSVLEKILNSWHWNLYHHRLQVYFGSDPAMVESHESDVASLLISMCGSRQRDQMSTTWSAELRDFSGDSNAMLESYTDDILGDCPLDKYNHFFLSDLDAQVFHSLIDKVGVSVESVENRSRSNLGDDALNYRLAVYGKVSPRIIINTSPSLIFRVVYDSSMRGTWSDQTVQNRPSIVGGDMMTLLKSDKCR